MAKRHKRRQERALAATHRLARKHFFTPRGAHHDLAEICDALIRDYADIFGRSFRVRITWGKPLRRGPARTHRSIRLGGYDDVRHVIIIHRTLDRAEVPRCYVEWIVFHELLHAKFEVPRWHGRHDFHPPWFRAMESTFAHQDLALNWGNRHGAVLFRF